MNEHAELKELLKKMEEANKKQVFYAKVQCLFSLIAAVCCVALLLLGIKFMPQIQVLADHANVVLTNLETVTEEQSIASIETFSSTVSVPNNDHVPLEIYKGFSSLGTAITALAVS